MSHLLNTVFVECSSSIHKTIKGVGGFSASDVNCDKVHLHAVCFALVNKFKLLHGKNPDLDAIQIGFRWDESRTPSG